MEPPENTQPAAKDDAKATLVPKLFTAIVLVVVSFLFVSLVFFALAPGLSLGQAARRLLFQCLYISALGFFLSTVARLGLDIMYSLFGLLQVNLSRLALWLFLSVFSLLPLGLIFAVLRLSRGFQA